MADLTALTSDTAEAAVLGSLLVNEDERAIVFGLLTPSDFQGIRHSWIFEAMVDCYKGERHIDLLNVASRLSDQRRLAECGGEAYLASLTMMPEAVTAMHVKDYARRVSELSQRRRMAQAIEQCAQLVFDKSIENDQLVAMVTKRVGETFGMVSTRKQARQIKDVMADFMAIIEARSEDPNSAAGITTGFPELDRLLGGGSKPGQLIVIAARPGMGKTSMMQAIMSNASMRAKSRGAVFTLEMTNEEVVGRVVASEVGIDSQRLSLGALREDEWANFTKIAQTISDWRVWLSDSPMRIDEIHRSAEQIQRLYGLDYVVIDYLGLVESPGKTDYERASAIAWGAKQIAKGLRVPVWLGCQLSRAVEQRESKRPTLSDLRDSGKIEEHSDIVMGLYRDEYYNSDTDQKNIAEVIILKQRNGPVGTINLFFDKRLTKFANLAREKIEL